MPELFAGFKPVVGGNDDNLTFSGPDVAGLVVGRQPWLMLRLTPLRPIFPRRRLSGEAAAIAPVPPAIAAAATRFDGQSSGSIAPVSERPFAPQNRTRDVTRRRSGRRMPANAAFILRGTGK